MFRRTLQTWIARIKPAGTAPADSMLFRELVADVVQNALKFTAFWLSGSQAMKAELMRASVDCLNHVTLFWVNRYSKRPPDINHNYGYERYKNLVAFLPTTLFLASGVYNIVFPLHEIFTGVAEAELFLTGFSLSVLSNQAITICSFGEFYLFYKNLGDLETRQGSSILRNFYRRGILAMKILGRWHPADPIHVVVVSENVTSVLGMSLPLLTSFLAYFTGMTFLDRIGCILNGSVQVYLAWSIFWDNTQKIKEILEDRDGVQNIEDIKSEYISGNKLKIAATIKYDLQEITENVMNEMEEDIKKTIKDPFKQAKVRKIAEKSIGMILACTTEIIQDIESDIKEEFPYVTQIDLEQSKDNINKAYEGVIPLTSDEEEDQKKKPNVEKKDTQK